VSDEIPPTLPRVRELFEQIVELPCAEQADALRELRATAGEIAKLEELLRADQAEGRLLDRSIAECMADLADPRHANSLLGRYAGPYRLTRLLGRGGSSVVFRAVRAVGYVEQVVAIKLLESGLYSDESRRRFRREQTILTKLSHPNIARFIDAGVTDEGVPYIAMEEATGSDILTHADSRNLSEAGRLRLLVSVCRAIEAAHRVLVVHRDIKPSNVLVSDEGHVHVLDFGIAKLVNDDLNKTATQHIVLTPGYAAPEQYVPGLVTTSADVYSLGVLGAELLTGSRLGPDATLPAANQANGTEAARRWHALDQDLANVLRAALTSEPAGRYASAGHMADDIERYLAGEPVLAHPPSTWYWMRKFILRNRGVALLIAILSMCILTSLAIAFWQAVRANTAADEAGRHAVRANSMRDFLFDAFSEAEPTKPMSGQMTVLEFVDRAIEKTRSDKRMDIRARTELQARLAEAIGAQGNLERSGQLLAQIHEDAIATIGGDDPLILALERSIERNLYYRGEYTFARAAVARLTDRVPASSAELKIGLLRDSAAIGVKLHTPEQAVRDARLAVELSRKLESDSLQRESLKTLASALLTADEPLQAAQAFEQELALSRKMFGRDSDQVAAALSGLSRAYRKLGELDKAESSVREALQIDRKIYLGDHWITSNHLNALGMIYQEKRDSTRAMEAFQETLRIDEAVLGNQHPDTAISLRNVASQYLESEEYAAAEPLLARALAINAASFGERNWQTAIIRAERGFASAMWHPGRTDGIGELEQAIADLQIADHRDAHTLARAIEKRVRLALSRNEPATASRFLAMLESQKPASAGRNSYWLGRIDCLHGEISLAAGRRADAFSEFAKCGAALDAIEQPDPRLFAAQRMLAAIASADVKQARALAAEGRQRLSALSSPPQSLLDLAARLPE
jgi:serine/threonine-protein kinase